MLAIHLAFVLLSVFGVFQLNLNQALAAQLSSFFIVLISSAILFFNNKGNPHAFTLRLLILTTTQLLGYLSILLALIYTNQAEAFIFYLLGLALSVLIIQTSYIVRRLK